MPAPTATSSPPRERYHHGDLRRALIAAAVAILAETQRRDFSLRAVARRAGVSHNAPYAHFADKRALLTAVASSGFCTLRDRMREACAQTESPAAALYATGRVYLCFGLENPALYRLMFGPDLRVGAGATGTVEASADAAWAVLHDVLCAGAADGSFDLDVNDEAEIEGVALARFALVHGFAMLAIDGLAGLDRPFDVDTMARQITDRFLRGLAR